MQSGLTHDKVVIASILLNIILFMIIYFIPSILMAFLISLVLLYACVKYIDKQKGFA